MTTFNRQLKKSWKDVLVIYTARWCSHSTRLEEIFHRMVRPSPWRLSAPHPHSPPPNPAHAAAQQSPPTPLNSTHPTLRCLMTIGADANATCADPGR